MTHRAIGTMLGALLGCGGPPTTAGAPPPPPSLVGAWRGTSTCTVRPSPCNDEVVVYHVTAGAGPDELAIQASKIVDGKELDMGTLPCRVEPAAHRIVCTIGRGTFHFAVDGDRLHGTLDLTDGTRFRVIEVERVR